MRSIFLPLVLAIFVQVIFHEVAAADSVRNRTVECRITKTHFGIPGKSFTLTFPLNRRSVSVVWTFENRKAHMRAPLMRVEKDTLIFGWFTNLRTGDTFESRLEIPRAALEGRRTEALYYETLKNRPQLDLSCNE
jgi:hypothetical protein